MGDLNFILEEIILLKYLQAQNLFYSARLHMLLCGASTPNNTVESRVIEEIFILNTHTHFVTQDTMFLENNRLGRSLLAFFLFFFFSWTLITAISSPSVHMTNIWANTIIALTTNS